LTTLAPSARRTPPLVRTADVLVALLALVVLAPLMALLALLVRLSSHGRVLNREEARDPSGRRTYLLSFRTVLDGGETETHARMRAIVGADFHAVLTPVGRVMRSTRLDRLPRLFNVLSGSTSLFSPSR
jgi:lipopolysaccharide/colanic/teichoic acid biosynthesis glycosyltransferase